VEDFGPFDTSTGYANTKDQAKTMPGLRFLCGAPSGFRTPDPLIKRQVYGGSVTGNLIGKYQLRPYSGIQYVSSKYPTECVQKCVQ